MSDLSDITILITSFLRPGCLREAFVGFNKTLGVAGCRLVIVDDGDDVEKTIDVQEACCDSKYQFIRLQFDSGLSAKRHAGVQVATTKYTLLGCDDFVFDTAAGKGIELMVEALDMSPAFDVIGGRVDNRPYEGRLEYVPGEYIKETRIAAPPLTAVDGYLSPCDLTVNYFLGRTEVVRKIGWPWEMRIGGEHVCFFLDLKLAGKRVAWVKGANINTQPYDPSKQDPRYPEFRARARTLGHPLMKKRYNIQRYIGFEGDVS